MMKNGKGGSRNTSSTLKNATFISVGLTIFAAMLILTSGNVSASTIFTTLHSVIFAPLLLPTFAPTCSGYGYGYSCTPLEITNFAANRTLVSGDQVVTLSNSTSGGTGGVTYNYTCVDCPDGGYLIQYEDGTVGFSTPGSYTIQLNVHDQTNETDSSTLDVQVNSTLEITSFTANRTVVDVGQSILFTNITSGGTGNNIYSYTVNALSGYTINGNSILFNTVGSYLVNLNVTDQSGETSSSSYSTGGISNSSDETSSLALALAPGYPLYICAGGSGNGNVSVSWTADANDTADEDLPYSSVGHQTNSTCNISTPDPALAVAGIGIPSTNYTLFTSATGSESELSHNLTYTVSHSGAFTVIAVGCGWYECNTITVPTGCIVQQYVNGSDAYETGFIATCSDQAAGTYNINATLTDTGGASLAAYVFPQTPGIIITVNPIPTTTTIPPTGGSTTSGLTGGGAFLPEIVVYSNGTQTGFQITNLTQDSFETLQFNNKTIHVTINFITPTSVGVTISNATTSQSYTLTLNNPVVIIDPNNYTYYAKLTGISYIPIAQTITLLIYGQPNAPAPTTPATPPAAPTTTIPVAPSSVTPLTVTTAPTTTIPPTPAASNIVPLIGVGVAIATAIAAGVVYARSGVRRRRRAQ